MVFLHIAKSHFSREHRIMAIRLLRDKIVNQIMKLKQIPFPVTVVKDIDEATTEVLSNTRLWYVTPLIIPI